jgi:hypothetical protein
MSSCFGTMIRRVVILSLLLGAGCTSSSMPKTYPVSGSVVYKGGQPMKGGVINFVPLEESPVRVSGSIGEDGKFSLFTVKDKGKISGAPPGEYHVDVVPPLSGQAKGDAPAGHIATMPIPLPGAYKIEAKDNRIEVQLPTPPPRGS